VMVLQVDEPIGPGLVKELEMLDGILTTRFVQLDRRDLATL